MSLNRYLTSCIYGMLYFTFILSIYITTWSFLHGSMWFEYCQSSSSYPSPTKHKHTGHAYPLYATEHSIHYTQSDYNLGFFCPIIANHLVMADAAGINYTQECILRWIENTLSQYFICLGAKNLQLCMGYQMQKTNVDWLTYSDPLKLT